MEQDHDPAAETFPAEPNPPAPEKVVQLAPPITTGNQTLTEAERLGIENRFLKIQNCHLQVQNCDNMKAQLIEQMRALQKEIDEFRAALSLKYGTDITRATVTPDGVIIRN